MEIHQSVVEIFQSAPTSPTSIPGAMPVAWLQWLTINLKKQDWQRKVLLLSARGQQRGFRCFVDEEEGIIQVFSKTYQLLTPLKRNQPAWCNSDFACTGTCLTFQSQTWHRYYRWPARGFSVSKRDGRVNRWSSFKQDSCSRGHFSRHDIIFL